MTASQRAAVTAWVVGAIVLLLALAGCQTGTASGRATVGLPNAATAATSPPPASAASSSASPGTTSGGSTTASSESESTTLSVLPTDSSAAASTSATPTPTPTIPPKPAAKVTVSPAFGAEGITPIAPLTVKVTDGVITKLTMTNPDGVAVKGKLAADKTSWTVAEDLGYGRTYTVTGTAKGENGKAKKIEGQWTTLTPFAEITTNVSPGDDAVVGVAAPIIIRFGFEAQDPALIEKNVKVVTDPEVEGAWAWIVHDGDDYASLDWRPKKYWPANTKVHVEANMYGLKFADNYYGGYDVTSDFTIGRNQVVYADATSHELVVKRDGETVAVYAASYGSGDDIGDPNRVTRSGIHIVMDKKEHTKMSNPEYGYVNLDEYWAVRISNNGEFIHQNQGTVDAQGNTNVSHGCVNLSAEHAQQYFESAIYGDPVEVTGTSVELSAADGDVYDWAIPWSEWNSMSALG